MNAKRKASLMLLIGAVALGGCTTTAKYDKLEADSAAQTQQLQKKIEESAAKLKETEAQVADLKKTNSDLQQQNDGLKERLALYRSEANPDSSSVQAVSGNDLTLEQEYIHSFLEVYDVNAKYYNSLLYDEIPGVKFKIKNKGSKTLQRVEVTVYFKDADGNAVAEEDYLPVYDDIISDYKLLKPNYVFQMEDDKFYSARTVPESWVSGSVDVVITKIEFAD